MSEFIEKNESLRTLTLGGEPFPYKNHTVEKLLKTGVNVLNIYGLTELSCWSCIHKVKETDLK